METYRQTFDNLHPKMSKTQFRISILAGLAYIAIGIANYYKDNDNILMTSIWIIGGIGHMIMASYQKHRNEKFFIEFNDIGIGADLSAFKTMSLKWDEINEIEIKPLAIVFKLKSDSQEKLSLSASSYASVLNIKAKLKEFANKKGIKMA